MAAAVDLEMTNLDIVVSLHRVSRPCPEILSIRDREVESHEHATLVLGASE